MPVDANCLTAKAEAVAVVREVGGASGMGAVLQAMNRVDKSVMQVVRFSMAR